jgi:hypothetical protein
MENIVRMKNMIMFAAKRRLSMPGCSNALESFNATQIAAIRFGKGSRKISIFLILLIQPILLLE